MKLLLDAHIWLWSMAEPKRLSRRVARVLADARNELWLSPLSTWELRLLARKGRLDFHGSAEAWISRALTNTQFREAPLTHGVVLATESITLPHRDPTDELLAATAKVYGLTLVTADENLIRAKGFSVLANV